MKVPTLFSFTPSLMNPAELEGIFVQRGALAADLVERVRESSLTQTKHHTLVMGARGMGKTHLVSLVYHRLEDMKDLEERLLIAWLREEEWGITSFLDLLLRIFRALQEENPSIQERVEVLYELSPGDAERLGIKLLEEIMGDRTLLLIAENLDDLFAGLGEKGQKQFRAFLQNSGCCTILATSKKLFNGVQRRTAPFYGFFRPVHLKELTAEEAVQMLAKIASLRGQKDLVTFLQTPTGKARVKAVQHLAGGNPRIYVIFADFLSQESLDKLVQPFVSLVDALTPYYQSRMQFLSPQQRKVVDFLCDRKYPAPVKDIAQRCFISHQTTSSQLKDLKEKGYVRVDAIGRESFYELQEPLMRICLGVKKERGEISNLIVDFLRNWYSKEELKSRYQHEIQSFGSNISSASKYLELALQENGSSQRDPRIAFYRTEILNHFKNEQFDAALKYCQELLEIDDSGSAYSMQADTLVRLDRYGEAIRSYEKNIEIDPNSWKAWNNKGVALNTLGRYTEAIVCFGEALKINPDFLVVLINRGLSLSHLERYEEAIDSYDKALKLNPESPEAWNNRGVAFGKLERNQEAIESYNKALKFTPNHFEAWHNMGDSFRKLKHYQEAIEAYNHALAIKPDLAESWFNKGVLLLEVERYSEAIDSLEKAIQYNFKTDSADIWACYGLALFREERYKDVIISCNKALQYKSDFPEILIVLGGAQNELGQYKEAITSFDKALTFKPNTPEYLSFKGSVLANDGQYEKAISEFEKAMKHRPDFLEAKVGHAELLLVINWPEGAKEMEKVLLRLLDKKEDYPSNAEHLLNGLLAQPYTNWSSRIETLLQWFQPHKDILEQALTKSCKKLLSPLISETTAILWRDTWTQAAGERPEFQIPLRLLNTALHHKQRPDDPRVFLELAEEERKILKQALGLE
jgi:tetratricopeptide (TPR) repeat protein